MTFTCGICTMQSDGSSKRYTLGDGHRGIACRDCWPVLRLMLAAPVEFAGWSTPGVAL